MATVSELFVRIGADTTALTKGLATASASVKSFGSTVTTAATSPSKSLKGLVQGLGGVSLAGATAGLALGKFAVDSFQAAKAYEEAFTRIDAISNTSAANIERWKGEVLTLAGETAQAPEELANALFFLSSAGLDAGQVMGTLEMAAKASAVGMGSVTDVAKITANALNAYADSGLTAAEVTDTLVAAVREGSAEPAEFAAALGRILPIASQAGVTFSDVTASLAALSNVGLDVNEGVTAMRGALQSIVAPGAQASKAMAKLGLSAQDLLNAIDQNGLVGALRLLDERAKATTNTQADYIGVLRQIIPNVRALTGVLGLTGQEADKVDAIFRAVTSSTGSLGRAFLETAHTDGFLMKKALNDIHIAGMQLAQQALPLVAYVLGQVADAVETVVGPFEVLFDFLDALALKAGNASGDVDILRRGLEILKNPLTLLPIGGFSGAWRNLSGELGTTADSLTHLQRVFMAMPPETLERMRLRAIGLADGFLGISAHADELVSVFTRLRPVVDDFLGPLIDFPPALERVTGSVQTARVALESLADTDASHLFDEMETSVDDFVSSTIKSLKTSENATKTWRQITTEATGDAAAAWTEFRDETASNLNFLGTALDQLGEDFKGSTSDITGIFNGALRDQRRFIHNLNTILRDGGKGAKLLVTQLLAGGPAAAAQAANLAAAPRDLRKEWERTAAQMQTLADRAGSAFTDKLLGPLQSIKTFFVDLKNYLETNIFNADINGDGIIGAKKDADELIGTMKTVDRFNPTVDIIAHDLATNALHDVMSTAETLDERSVDIWLRTHRVTMPHGGGLMHSGGMVPASPEVVRHAAAQRFHDGGLKPDEIPAILQRGEFVIRRSSVEKIGLPTLQTLNRMHEGGPVQPVEAPWSVRGVRAAGKREDVRMRVEVDRRRFGRDLDYDTLASGR